MYEGCRVKLKMKRAILEGEQMDNEPHGCSMIKYVPEEEKMYLLLEEGTLPDISLDAVYNCQLLKEEEENLTCSGMVVERFGDKRGNVLVFQVENGFYKNNLN